MKIGFIGVGNMGGPMVRNLIKAGHQLTVFDVAAAALQAAVKAGAGAAASAAAAADGAEAVITMLPAGAQVAAIYDGKDGIIARAAPGTLLIDCSTIDVETARGVAAKAAEHGLDMLDAPVSGGISGAEAGTLTFMVGGSAAAIARARPLFESMGQTVVHAGPSGNGQAAKICNNMILGITMIALSEAFTLGQSLGLDAKTLFQIASKSSGSCWAMLNHLPIPGVVEKSAANHGFKPGFSTEMMLKDMRLAQRAALATGVPSPLGAEAAALYGLSSRAGRGALDYSVVVKLIAGD